MATSIKQLIEEAVKSSMKDRNKERTTTLRMAVSEFKKEEIDKIRIDFENFINLKIHLISTISGEGIDQLINEILKLKNI